MNRIPLGLALLFACTAAFAQESARGIVTIPTRPGVTQSFFTAGMGEVKPQAVALIYNGGYGTLQLRMEGGQPKFQPGNFLIRARREFIRNGVLPVLDEIAGVVLTSSMILPGRSSESLAGFNFKAVKTPLLFVHHRGDGCEVTPYPAMARAAEGFTLISVKGGKPPESGPCEPFAPHGFYGKEAETVDAIAAWMLKKPFAKEIE